MTRFRRLRVATALGLLAMSAATGLLAAPAAEATSYRYWTYWLGGDGAWSFSTRGADRVPADGTVDGWRFAVSQAASSSSTPSIGSSFNDICGGTAPVAGMKRVGLVIDYGTAADAPPGESAPSAPVARCRVVKVSATGYEVLTSATTIRVDAGMICGITGYPTSGCGEPVADPKPTGDGSSGGGSSNHNSNSTGGSAGGDRQDGATTPHPNESAGTGPTAGTSSDSGSNGAHHRGQPGSDGPKAVGRNPTGTTRSSAKQAEVVAALNTTIAEPVTPSSPIGLIAGIAVLAALAGAGVTVARRRR